MGAERHRGCFGAVRAMARPRRAMAEADAVEQAFAAMPEGLSRSAKASRLAARVARELVAQSQELDPVDMALRRARVALGEDIALALAIAPEFGLFAMVEAARVDRFRARGCAFLDQEGWERETAEIEIELTDRLAERFRRTRKKLA